MNISNHPARSSARNIAIVGAGKMAAHHARSIGRAEGPARVVAVVDPSDEAREAMREAAPAAAGFRSFADLNAANLDIDVVHVCTPPDTHEAVAAEALEAGCHVYVEKPFAETAEGARRLIELADSKGLKLCAGHQLLFEAPAREALELLPAAGSLAHVESYFSFRTVRRTPDGRAPMRSDQQMLDILPHPVYTLLRVLERAVPEGSSELTSLEVGPAGTVHALVRRGTLTGTLVVTLAGRPVESYLRLVGGNGTIHADFVRGTVQRSLGPGTSGIDKLLNPYRQSRQLLAGTTVSLGKRAMNRQRSYPGLVEIIEAFYVSIRDGSPSPIPPHNILDTVRICETVAEALRGEAADTPSPEAPAEADGPRVAVTGGTGFLGREVVRRLTERGARPLVLARREPAGWEQIPGAEYRSADLSQPLPDDLLEGVEAVIHTAAETAGGFDEHQRNSIDATEHMLRAAAKAGVKHFIQVSSLAVLAAPSNGQAISDDGPLEPNPRGSGPYVWGKLESERLAVRLGSELGVGVKVVRPGPIIDDRDLDPPGRLGRRVGNVFVAAGSPGELLPVVDVRLAARTLAWMVENFSEAPDTLNLLAPRLPTRREMVTLLKQTNPDLRVVWLPRVVLTPGSKAAVGMQKALRRGKEPIDIAKAFASPTYDTSRMAAVAGKVSGALRV